MNRMKRTSMKYRVSGSFVFWALAMFTLILPSLGLAVTPEFAALHRDPPPELKNAVLKKVIFTAGLMNAGYHGLNDLVAALMLVKGSQDPKVISAQLFAVKVGLDEKPSMFRYIAREMKYCQQYPNFPLGFADGPEGPEPLSVEFEKIANDIEKLNIQYQLTNLTALKKEANRVTFAIFWTASEKIRTLCQSVLNFLRMEMKEDLPFEVFTKPAPK